MGVVMRSCGCGEVGMGVLWWVCGDGCWCRKVDVGR